MLKNIYLANKDEFAFHCTVEYMDPCSKMRVGRTYLTTSNLKFN